MSPQALRVGLISLGCPKNLVDTEVLAGLALKEGFVLAPSPYDCDIALINTCAFVRDAKEESLSAIRELVEKKKQGKIRRLIVVGCLPQKYGKEIKDELPEIDAFLGTGEIPKISATLKKVSEGESVFETAFPQYLYDVTTPRLSLTLPHSRYLKVAEGCSHACSFCMIPELRGHYRSRTISSVVEEAAKMVSEGAQEINLIAQDLTYFGMDTEKKLLLPSLLKELEKISNLNWIRLMYSYPSFVNEELISAICDCPSVCHYLDMPLQHASDHMLFAMRRGMTQAKTKNLITRLRRAIPDLALRTTFMTGFPGETEADFKELESFVREMQFDRVGVFAYSDEPTLASYSLQGKVPEKIKEERRGHLMAIQQKISLGIHRSFEGNVMEVLVDAASQEGGAVGRTYRDAPDIDGKVIVASKKILKAGDRVKVKITKGLEYDLEGELNNS